MTPNTQQNSRELAEKIVSEWYWNEAFRDVVMAVGAREHLVNAIATQLQSLLERVEKVEGHLNNLLCRIHRDGGHYLHQHGLEKAVTDADEKVANLNVEHDERDRLAKDKARWREACSFIRPYVQKEHYHDDFICGIRLGELRNLAALLKEMKQ